uniref:Putative secreted protein n=1 Tax=Anopheles darlingi TaxID=43151 RepID=A0A2M4DPR1_ANODA
MVALVPLPASLLLLLIALFRTIHHLQHDFGLRRTSLQTACVHRRAPPPPPTRTTWGALLISLDTLFISTGC